MKKTKTVNKKVKASYKPTTNKTPNYTSKKDKWQDNNKVNVRKARIG